MSASRRTVGVIGGLGPAATADFFFRLVSRTEARRDQDHLHIIIDNNPLIPDRNAARKGGGPSPAPDLAASAQRLESAGAEILCMACNTAHAYERDIRAAIRRPFLSMIDATLEETSRRCPQARTVGVLAVDACLEAELYQKSLAAGGRSAVILEGGAQASFMTAINAIKAGEAGDEPARRMRAAVQELTLQGAEAIIAGCTEIPLVLHSRDAPVPLISSTDALVERVIIVAGGALRKSDQFA
jgi:aspartate racemase